MIKIIITAIIFYFLGLFTRNIVMYIYKIKKSIKIYEHLQKIKREDELKEKKKKIFREKYNKL